MVREKASVFSQAPKCALALLTFVLVSEAKAETRPQLVWERGPGAEGCVDEETLRGAVDERHERPTFAERSARQIRGRIEKTEDGAWSVVVVSYDGEEELGRREVSQGAKECSTLTPAIALIVSLATESTFPETPAPSPREPKPTREPAPVSQPEPQPEPASLPDEPWRFAVGAEGSAQLGWLPGVAPGLGLWAHAGPSPRHAFGLGVRAWPHARKDSPDGDLVLRALTISPHYCHTIGPWQGCARADLGVIHARGEGFATSRTKSELLASLGLGFGRRVALDSTRRLHLTPSIFADVPLVRPAFRYEVAQLDEALLLYQATPISLGAKVSIEYHF